MKSHVFTDEERGNILPKLDKMSAEKASNCIEWLQAEQKDRKAAEAETAAA